MATIVTRAGKGSPLSNTEVDSNFTNLNADVSTRATGTGTASGTNTGDQTASSVANTPAGNIVAATVQAALNELDAEKVPRTSATGSIIAPVGTTAERDVAPATGYLRYNTTLSSAEVYSGAVWTSIGGASTASNVSNTPTSTIAAVTVQGAINELDAKAVTADAKAVTADAKAVTADAKAVTADAKADAVRSLLTKADYNTPCLLKTGASTLSIKAGTTVKVGTSGITFAVDTAVTMHVLVAGSDFSVWVKPDGTAVSVNDPVSAPATAPVAGAVKIGGGHYGLVAPATTVAGGSFATTGTGMIWTQPNVDDIAGINKYSLWDIKFRSSSNDPLFRGQKGFFYSALKNEWGAIYIASTDTDTNGLSRYNTNIASGTVVPKIPAAVGGNGTATYTAPTWWDFQEIASAYGCRMMSDAGFNIAAFGVTENQSIGGAASTYPTTLRSPGYTSRFGMEQATGHHWIWGSDSSGTTSAGYIANGGRGQSYAGSLVRPLLGGARDYAANSGSRCSYWGYGPGNVGWFLGLRAACDHLQLD